MLQLCCSTVLCMLLLVCVLVNAHEEDKNTTAGQNVILTCRAPNYNIIVADWSRADLGSEYVLLYRDGRFDPENQHPSFKNRVDLQDRHMKDGDVSLILKNVTINDTGTYECRVANRRTNRGKRAVLKSNPIIIIYLSVVVPPGQTGGDTEDGGKEAGGKEDGVNRGRPGLSVFAVICVVIAAFVISGKLKNTNSSIPPPEQQEA